MSGRAPTLEQIPAGWSVLMTHDQALDNESYPMLIASNAPLVETFADALLDGRLTRAIHPTESIDALPPDGVLVVAVAVQTPPAAPRPLVPGEGTENFPPASRLVLNEAAPNSAWTGHLNSQRGRRFDLTRAVEGQRLDVKVYFGADDPPMAARSAAQEALGGLTVG